MLVMYKSSPLLPNTDETVSVVDVFDAIHQVQQLDLRYTRSKSAILIAIGMYKCRLSYQPATGSDDTVYSVHCLTIGANSLRLYLSGWG